MEIEIELLQEADISIILEWNKNKNSDFLYKWAGKGYTFPLTRKQLLSKIISPGELVKTGYSSTLLKSNCCFERCSSTLLKSNCCFERCSSTLLKSNCCFERCFSTLLKHIVFKIINQTRGTMIGTVELSKIDRENKKAYVSRFLIGEEENRNKGYGTKALKKVIQFAHNKLGLKILVLKVFDFNKNAMKCYENAGFKRTKYMEKTRKTENGFWNAFTMKLSINEST